MIGIRFKEIRHCYEIFRFVTKFCHDEILYGNVFSKLEYTEREKGDVVVTTWILHGPTELLSYSLTGE